MLILIVFSSSIRLLWVANIRKHPRGRDEFCRTKYVRKTRKTHGRKDVDETVYNPDAVGWPCPAGAFRGFVSGFCFLQSYVLLVDMAVEDGRWKVAGGLGPYARVVEVRMA